MFAILMVYASVNYLGFWRYTIVTGSVQDSASQQI